MKSKRKIIITILIIIFCTTCLVSATFAKYISAVDLTDSARVAIWDIEINKESRQDIDLFSKSYLSGAQSLNGEKIVAPGTSGEYKFRIQGKPETSYKINIQVDEDNTYDCIRRLIYVVDGERAETLEEAAYLIQSAYDSDEIYLPGKEINDLHTISWFWEFELGESTTGATKDEIDAMDKIDTALGSGKLRYDDDVRCKDAKVKISFKISAEQVTMDD